MKCKEALIFHIILTLKIKIRIIQFNYFVVCRRFLPFVQNFQNIIKMEENQPKTGKSALMFGLLTGGVGIIFAIMLFTMEMQYERGVAVQGVQIAILAAGIILAVAQFKKTNSGYLNISQALKVGAGVALIAGIVGLLWFFVFSNLIEPDFMDKSMELAKVKTFEDNPKMTEEQWKQGVEMQKKFAWITYPVILIFNIIIGLIVGLVSGLVMKKQNPAY